MPRPSPFTQADVKARSRLTGLRKEAGQSEDVLPPPEVVRPEVITANGRKTIRRERRVLGGITDEMRHYARNWDFSEAITTLGVMRKDYRDLCQDELILICINNKLARLAEEQETPGRKVRALQLAPRVARKLTLLAQEGHKALWLKQRELWLPPSLEQEAVRALAIHLNETVGEELDHIPRSRDDFAPLRKKMMRLARRGGYKSWALRNTIHALQACAATWCEATRKKTIWDENRDAPPKQLLKFLVQVLRAADIQHPDPEQNSSKFVRLMLRPRKPTEQQTEQPTEQPPKPSKAERRLAKVFL